MAIKLAVKTVVALDPGVTTGYAEGQITDEGELLVVTGQERWSHLELWNFLKDYLPQEIICEDFQYRNRSRAGLELYSKELIGICHLYAEMHVDYCKMTLQNPLKNTESTYFNDYRLKFDNIFKPGREHANDAARHLLTWFSFRSGYQYNKKGYKSAVD